MTVADVLGRLEKVKPNGSGWMACCPAHEDRTPSLSVSEGSDGRVLLKCFAGCSPEAIAGAIGLQVKDLFADDTLPPRRGMTVGELATLKQLPESFLRELGLSDSADHYGRNAVVIPYRDQDGNVAGRKTRTGGRWFWEKGRPPMPYGLERLAALPEGRSVLLVEGESDCWTAWHHGIDGVLGVPGANAWRPEWAKLLEGRDVFVWQEPDAGGKAFVAKIGKDIPELRVIRAPAGVKDLNDLHAQHPDELRERLRELVSSAVPASLANAPAVSVRSMADYLADPHALEPPQPVVSRFAWSERSTLLACREKGGKSTLAAAATAAASTGRSFLGVYTPRLRTLYADFEEHPRDLIQRLTDFNAEPSNVWIMDRLTTDDPIGELETATELVKPGLIVIDTLFALVATFRIESGDGSGWTPVMDRLTRIARDSGAALLILHHGRKEDGKYRDSTAIGAGVDVILEMRDGSDAGERRISAKGRWHIEEFTVRLVGVPGAADFGFELATGELSVDARVILFVEREPGCTTRAIRDGVEARAREIDAAIRRLSAQDVMVNTGTETRHAWEVVRNAGNPQGHGTDTVQTHLGTHPAVRGGGRVPQKAHPLKGGCLWDTVPRTGHVGNDPAT